MCVIRVCSTLQRAKWMPFLNQLCQHALVHAAPRTPCLRYSERARLCRIVAWHGHVLWKCCHSSIFLKNARKYDTRKDARPYERIRHGGTERAREQILDANTQLFARGWAGPPTSRKSAQVSAFEEQARRRLAKPEIRG